MRTSVSSWPGTALRWMIATLTPLVHSSPPMAFFRHGDNSLVNHGRQEIVDFYTDRLTAFGPTYHYPHSHIIEFQSDTEATGMVTAHAELAVEDKTFAVALRYHDQYSKDDGCMAFL